MKRKQNGKAILLVVVILVLLAGGLVWFWASGKGQKVRNVLLISLDTTRADYLGCYGSKKSATPNLDALAAAGTLFEHAITPVGLTLPSHCSVLTGTYPPYHQVHENVNMRLSQANVTLAEVLSEHGFATAAVVSSDVLDKPFGLAQGFDIYDDQFERPADEQIDDPIERSGGEAARQINKYLTQYKDKRFFMFAHFYDPHIDYAPPEPFASQYADDPYAGEIAYTDQCVGEVINKLKELGLYDSTLIVVLGDHGEGLGEHGEAEHGYFLYHGTVRVPLIVRSPHQAGGRKISEIVSLVDVMPTILSYLDVSAPESVQGVDLSDGQGGQSDSEDGRYVYTESMIATRYGCNPMLGLVSDRWKYIETKRPELYDLKKDPGERDNLIEADPQVAQHMRDTLAEMTARLALGGETVELTDLDEESRRRLESLGYVGGENTAVSFTIDQNKDEAKDLIAYHEASMKVYYLLYHKEYDQVRAVCAKMLEDFPELFNTYHLLGRAGFEAEQWEECIPHLTTYIELATSEQGRARQSRALDPNRALFAAYRWLAESHYKLKQYEQAAEYCRTALEFNYERHKVYNNLAAALYKLDEFDEAATYWRHAVALEPNNPETHYKLGTALFKLGEDDETEEHWNQALRLKPDWNEVRYKLDHLDRRKKTVVKRREREEAAIAKLVAALENDPNNADIHDTLAGTCYSLKRMSLAVNHWNEYLSLRPDDYMVMNNLAWLLAANPDPDIRQPQEALRLATRAAELTQFKNPGILDTVAVAQAGLGDYEAAVETAETAIDLAEAGGNSAQAERIRTRMQFYKERKPYRSAE